MYISYDYYRVFYYVAKYGNVSQAAKLLLNNQPNLTRTIRNLESELGCPLFSRTNRGMKLTPEGERLYAHVRIAFEHIEAGEAELTEARNLQTGTVYIAASEVALRCLLLPVLKQYRLLYPGVHIRISNHSTPQAIAALKDGAADIAVVTTPTVRSASLVETAIRPIQEVAVCSSAFPGLTGRPWRSRSCWTIPSFRWGRIPSPLRFIPISLPVTACPFTLPSRHLPPTRYCRWWRPTWASGSYRMSF